MVQDALSSSFPLLCPCDVIDMAELFKLFEEGVGGHTQWQTHKKHLVDISSTICIIKVNEYGTFLDLIQKPIFPYS